MVLRLITLLRIKSLSKQISKLIKSKSPSPLAMDLITICRWIYLLRLSLKTLKLLFSCRRLRSFLRKRIKMPAGRVSMRRRRKLLKKSKKKFQLKNLPKKKLIMHQLMLRKFFKMSMLFLHTQPLHSRKRTGIRLTWKSLKTWKPIR